MSPDATAIVQRTATGWRVEVDGYIAEEPQLLMALCNAASEAAADGSDRNWSLAQAIMHEVTRIRIIAGYDGPPDVRVALIMAGSDERPVDVIAAMSRR